MKEYALRIENPEHKLIFNLLFDAKEFENTKLWLGTVEMQTKDEKEEVDYVEAKCINLMDLLMFMDMVDEND